MTAISNLLKSLNENQTLIRLMSHPLGRWAVVLTVLSLMAMFVGLTGSWIADGRRGIRNFVGVVGRGLRDLVLIVPRRVFAIATLTARESIRRKALWVGAVFLVLFMFAGWFIGDTTDATPAKNYISFVMTTVRWMLLPVAVLLSCWGLPADIRDRSLHTVVTKPVRRSEVVLGRIGGYVAVVTMLLLVVSAVGYMWILRIVPERSQRQLISRVPQYSNEFYLLGPEGKAANEEGGQFQGRNVGDLLDFRRFIEGGTKERAVWTFQNLSEKSLSADQVLRLEYRFEAFRSYKGDVATEIEFSAVAFNPKTNLRVHLGTFPVNEFSTEVVHDLAVYDEQGNKKEEKTENLIQIPLTIPYSDDSSESKTADLFKDLVNDGALTIEVGCLDAQQYLGSNMSDLFLRLPDRSFASTYWKAIFVQWLLTVLIITIGTTASCFLKGPVSTLATFGLLILGSFLKNSLIERLNRYYTTGDVVGGGSIEAFYRIVTGMNESTPLDDSLAKRMIEGMDGAVYGMLYIAQYMIPNIAYFDGAQYAANGFDVSWQGCLLPSLLITIGFLVPAYIIGYFGLQIRELEAK
jgi:hypothetical protein